MTQTRDFITFELERMQSVWENVVEYNITESGVHPMSIRELVQDEQLIEDLLNMPLVYPQTNGTPELRRAIAAHYPGATEENVIVTVGAVQANFSAVMTLLQPGDELAVMIPNYMQIWGTAKNLGITVRTFSLDEERDWALNIDSLKQAVNKNTKLIAICNPNNPTGYILTPQEIDAVIEIADSVGAWLLSDEVYAGAEHLTDEITPSLYGRYDKVLAVNSMSKAFGLPGLRLGWIVAPPELVEEIWHRQDYITICTTPISNRLATYALSPEVHQRIIDRTRRYVRQGYTNLKSWLDGYNDIFTYVPPQAAAIAFVRYKLDVNSTELVKRMIHEKNTLFVPGDAFGLDHHLRIGFGEDTAYVMEALSRLAAVIEDYR